MTGDVGRMAGECRVLVVVVQWLSCVQLFATTVDCNMPGFIVLHHLLELAQTHVH